MIDSDRVPLREPVTGISFMLSLSLGFVIASDILDALSKI